MSSITFTFNNHPIEAEAGTSILEAVTQAGYEIPHYCYHSGLTAAGSCRLCAVETGIKDSEGHINMGPKLVMACKTPVTEGLIVRSDTEKVRRHQQAVMEFLLINHPLDCPVCDQAGECYLQDYSYRYGRATSRYADSKNKQPKKDIGRNIVLYSDRCILCTRCVRFCREISGGEELAVVNRGNRNEIDIFPGKGLDNKLAGNIVDICPVGAMLDKQFLFKQRVWFLETTESICPRCSRGCNISIHHHQGVIWRIKPRFCGEVNGHWMCDDGRYGFKYVQSDSRLLKSRRRGEGNEFIDQEEACQAVTTILQPYLQEEPTGRIAAILSPAVSCEEQYLLACWVRDKNPAAILARGPVFGVGQDEIFKNGFTISSEKVPNRRGAEAVLKHFGGEQMTFAQLADSAAKGEIDAVIIQGGYPWLNWCPEDTCEKLRRAKVLILQDILEGKLAESADIVLAGASWAEKKGCFINDQDIPQLFDKALDPPGEALAEGEWLWALADRRKEFSPVLVREEMKITI